MKPNEKAREFEVMLGAETPIGPVINLMKCSGVTVANERLHLIEYSAYQKLEQELEKFEESTRFYRNEWESALERLRYRDGELKDAQSEIIENRRTMKNMALVNTDLTDKLKVAVAALKQLHKLKLERSKYFFLLPNKTLDMYVEETLKELGEIE